jgi:hypothetical protein
MEGHYRSSDTSQPSPESTDAIAKVTRAEARIQIRVATEDTTSQQRQIYFWTTWVPPTASSISADSASSSRRTEARTSSWGTQPNQKSDNNRDCDIRRQRCERGKRNPSSSRHRTCPGLPATAHQSERQSLTQDEVIHGPDAEHHERVAIQPIKEAPP